MIDTLIITVKIRGTEKEVNRIKARFAALSSSEEIVSMFIKTKT